MVGRGYLVGGAAAGATLMTIVVAHASRGSLIGATALPPAERRPPPVRRGRPLHAVTGKDTALFPHWLVILMSALLLLYALGLLIIIVMSKWERRAVEKPEELDDYEPPEPPPWNALLSTELSDAADETLLEISQGEPRNAIVACWLRLQAATARAGVTPVASETAQEYTVRALHRLSLDAAAITTLSELYREARFSEHRMGEKDREQARAALGVLADQLREQHVRAAALS